MVDNGHGFQHRRNLRGESLSDVAPGQLPRNQYGQATLVADDQDEVLSHPTSTVTQSSRDSPPLEELPIDPENRLFDSAPRSPQLSTMDSPPSNERRYITEEDSMPPTLREARPFLRSANPLVPETELSLRDLRAVLANTSQTEADEIRAGQEARMRLHDASMEVQQAEERLDITRRVSQATQRRIQQHENVNRVFGTREQVESQGDNYVSPITAMFERTFGPRIAAQRAAAEVSAMSNTTQAARSHSHPSRRDESRTDQSSPSSSSPNPFTTDYLGPLDPMVSELHPLARHRMMMGSLGGPGAQENLHPSNNSTSHSRQAGVQTSSTRNPPVFANLTNAVERSSSRAPRHQPSSDDRLFLGPRLPIEFRPENFRQASHIEWRPQDSREIFNEWERDLLGLSTADASRRLAPVPPPISAEEANRRLRNASTSQAMSVEETNRRLVESNAWNPHSSDPGPSVEYANANPFSSSNSDNQQSNPLMAGARALYSTDRSRTNMIRGTAGQGVVDMKPPPKTKAEMTVDIECRICMEQPATVACLPCGNQNSSRFLGVASLTICRPLRDV